MKGPKKGGLKLVKMIFFLESSKKHNTVDFHFFQNGKTFSEKCQKSRKNGFCLKNYNNLISLFGFT